MDEEETTAAGGDELVADTIAGQQAPGQAGVVTTEQVDVEVSHGGGEPAAPEPVAVSPVPVVEVEKPQQAETTPVPPASAGQPAGAPRYLRGAEVARARNSTQSGFDGQLSLLTQDTEFRRKILVAVLVVFGVFLAGILAGAILGIFV